ncbi:MAG: NAD(P)-binding domain-containing protein [Lachnospiraceae bacterium]|nr:NAD(P)-binding domain-containing protein [Lachnospiraceae bacterium]
MNISLLEPIGVSKEMIYELSVPIKKAGHKFTYYDSKTTDVEELKKRTENQDIVMIANNPYPADVVNSADRLKMLAVAFTGIDHVAADACREKGITVCNCAGYSNICVSELCIGMAIDLLRFVNEGDRAVREGKTSQGLCGREIHGKKAGIIGCGQIGFMTAMLFKAFGAKVYAYARHERDEVKKEGIEYVPLDTLLSECDIVSLHLPNNAETKGLISKEKIALMKKTAVFINCARGPIVDNNALAAALNAEEIAAAAIDVFDCEPPVPSDYPLVNAKNTLLTPHVAFLSEEAMIRRAKIEFDNVYAFLRGQPENVCML